MRRSAIIAILRAAKEKKDAAYNTLMGNIQNLKQAVRDLEGCRNEYRTQEAHRRLDEAIITTATLQGQEVMLQDLLRAFDIKPEEL